MINGCHFTKLSSWGQDTACKTTLLHTNKKMWVIKNTTNLEGCSLVVTSFFFSFISCLLPDSSESPFQSTASLVSSDPRRSSCWPHCHSSPRTPPENKKKTESCGERVRCNQGASFRGLLWRPLTSVSGCHRSNAFWDFSFAHTEVANKHKTVHNVLSHIMPPLINWGHFSF